MKLNFNIKNRVIDELKIDNENIILPWGVETADSYGFFSLEKEIGYRHEIVNYICESNNNKYNYLIINNMPEGKWRLEGTDSVISDNIINRKVELLCLEDTVLMDFVLRYRFKKEYFDYAIINNKKIEYNYSNVYNQHEVNKVELIGKKYKITIKINDMSVPKGMKPYMYVRDSNISDEWIVHVRMLPFDSYKTVIKLCNRWYKTMPINQKLANMILRNDKIKGYFLYRNEKKPYKNYIMKTINPNAFNMIKLKKGTKLIWNVDCIVENNCR